MIAKSKAALALTVGEGRSYNRPVRIGSCLWIAVSSLGLISGCNRDKAQVSPIAGHNVLLITLDTTRADRLGCYGYANAKTPALDAVAARGALFEDAVAQVPLTLPSHCSIMTGRLPKEFGVRINNQAALGTAHPTLASIFKQHGYRTGAFVATFVLDSRFGLDRGFDVYEDEMANVSTQTQPLEWEQPANVVADRAIAWLDSDTSKPFFSWVHFYDPHDPYTPPEPYPKTYDAEIAFMDTQIKRLTDWLDKSRQRDRTLLIVVGDHGESFGEHGEEGHGIFLYHTSLHVPLLLAHPLLTATPMRVGGAVGAVDVFPTVLELMGWQLPAGLHSQSFATALEARQVPPRQVYSESDYVWHSYGWAQQRSFTSPDWKCISSAKPELYDRKNDPGERTNLVDNDRGKAAECLAQLHELYAALEPEKAGEVAKSAESSKALMGLGYIEQTRAGDEFLSVDSLDPKDKLHVIKNYKLARSLIKQEKYDQAIALLDAAAREAPDSLAIHAAHGLALVKAGQYEQAIEVIKSKALPLDPRHQPAIVTMGDAYYFLKNFEKARDVYREATRNDPTDSTAHYKLGKALLELKITREAQDEFESAIKIFPDFPEAHFDLGVLLGEQKQFELAAQHYEEAIRLKPEDQQAYYNLGVVLLSMGKFDEAAQRLGEATRLKPDHGEAWINLGIALLQAGKRQEGVEALTRATQIPSSAIEAHLNLSVAALKQNDRAAAQRHLEEVLKLSPGHPDAIRALERLRGT